LLQNEGDTKVNEVEIRAQMSYLTLSYCVDILLAESVFWASKLKKGGLYVAIIRNCHIF